MFRIAGRLLIAWSVIAFGAGALAGQALHALPGCGHEDRHDEDPAGDREHSRGPSSSDGDCVICLAIDSPTMPGSTSQVVGLTAVSTAKVEAAPLAWIPGHSGRWCCRAPPPLFGSIWR